MKPGIIFLAGVHGAGKGFLSSRLPFRSFSASALIRQQKQMPIDHEKIVIGAGENQDLLVSALQGLKIDRENILLDGHFVLRTKDAIFEVPISTFQSMNLKAIILLTAEPTLIHSRLVERDGVAMEISEIQMLQQLEKARAQDISKQLSTPLLEAGQNRETEICAWLSQASILT